MNQTEKNIEKWRFTYTTESSYKKAVFKNGSLKRGKTKFVITNGHSYSEAYTKARVKCRFNESQLIGCYKIN